ncbi:MAG TPA: response regulator transcription factor [Thermoleophilaceae bacterium]|nr:response regulator transcription factor [Thermoleophilaceae bacterium]
MSEEVAASTTSIVIADDHTVMRSGLKTLLEAEHDLEVVADAGDSEETIRKLKAYKPAVLLLDLQMPHSPSLQLIAALREASPDTKIVVLAMQGSARSVREALRAGAIGYVPKDATYTELLEAVRLAAAEQPFLQQLGAALDAEPADGGPPDNLTEREVEVLRLIALGHTNTEIASQLYLSVRTVESHRAHIQQKLRLSRRAELVRYALDHRLVQA